MVQRVSSIGNGCILLHRAHKQFVPDKAVFQQLCHLAAEGVFDQLSGQLLLELLLQLLVLGQQRNRFDVHQSGCHLQKFAGNLQLLALHLLDIIQILLEQLCNLNVIDVQLVLGDQLQDQVQRTFHLCDLKGKLLCQRSFLLIFP